MCILTDLLLTFAASISISSSSNVFMEALDNVRDEMTMLFLNSNQNQMEFPFIRKSGMEISIKVSQTFLIPEYVDLDHEDDAPFFFRDIYQTHQMKERMRFLQHHYCRSVTILLQLSRMESFIFVVAQFSWISWVHLTNEFSVKTFPNMLKYGNK